MQRHIAGLLVLMTVGCSVARASKADDLSWLGGCEELGLHGLAQRLAPGVEVTESIAHHVDTGKRAGLACDWEGAFSVSVTDNRRGLADLLLSREGFENTPIPGLGDRAAWSKADHTLGEVVVVVGDLVVRVENIGTRGLTLEQLEPVARAVLEKL